MHSHLLLKIGTWPGGINTKLFYSIYSELSNGSYLNIVGNIVLFLPYGLALGLIFTRGRLIKVGASGAIFSVVIELIQLFVPNRWTDIDDVLLNTFGSLLGGAFAFFFVDRSPRKLQ
ncbi:VanZ family protein [Domibacillus robiginosus]|uniref:VanZ family protein n=1 Tax=Domibacillus robiginosus TaxID=1071054 RepID=UPI0009E28465|nr:VanZ family protein [Domibacillus robiginosus]